MILIVTIAGIIPAIVKSQPGFNIFHDYGYQVHQNWKPTVHNDTIVMYGLVRLDSFPNQQCLLVARFDSSGQQIDHRLICDPNGDNYTISVPWANIFPTNDGGFAMTAINFGSDDGMMIKLYNDLSIEFAQTYLDTINELEFCRFIIETEDGYVLFGDASPGNVSRNSFVRKVNKQGEEEYFEFIGNENIFNNLINYGSINDSLVVLAGVIRPDVATTSSSNPWVVIYDTKNLKVHKEWIPSEALRGAFTTITPLQNGDFITQGVEVVSDGPVVTYQPYVALLDSTFQFKNIYKKSGNPNPNPSIKSVLSINDSTYLAVGQINADDPNVELAGIYGWLWAFTSTADSLWEHLVYTKTTNNLVSGGEFMGAGKLSSGNIIAAGQTTRDCSGGTFFRRCPWLVKITPDGCIDDMWCNLPSFTTEPYSLSSQIEVRAIPNPTTGRFRLDLPDKALPAKRSVLYDMFGTAFPAHTNSAGELNIALYPAGTYILLILGDDNNKYRARIIKN
jgi:hypothetical protein